ncbi:hypothetical protein [Leifsonia xyli]|uniref:hypothetical protein n=1 Tax=Leifsonia xyli TaxID=1575 RepID=UPI003D67961F
MRLREVFGFDVRRAINATRPRRVASFCSMLVLVALAIIFGAVAPWWVWPALLIVEGIVFLILGNRWAAKDALRREED